MTTRGSRCNACWCVGSRPTESTTASLDEEHSWRSAGSSSATTAARSWTSSARWAPHSTTAATGHPAGGRYRGAIGREVVVPFVERRVPVIADVRVEPEFGTGALKITPGHDPTDWEIGRDHHLLEPMVIGLDGRMSAEAGELAGLTQAEADERVLAWIKDHDQLEKRESYRHAVGHCNRSGDRVEP